MSINRRLISTRAGAVTCATDSADPFGDSSGVALYSMDFDASDAGGLYDGTPTNVDFGVGGQINYGARFNGSNSKIDTGDSIISTGAFSASFWTKLDTLPSASSPAFVSNESNTGNVGFEVGINYITNKVHFFFGAGSVIVNSNSALVANTWYHIACTYDGTNLKMYIDGNLQTQTSTGTLSAATNNLHIGKSAAFARYIDGTIDQVRLFSKALNQTEVDTLFAEEACVYTSTTDIVNYPTGTTPVAYYKLDNSSEDYSTGGNDGTDTNIEYRFGRYGQAAVFNGSSSKIVTGFSLYNISTVSLSGWVNLDSFTSTPFNVSMVFGTTQTTNASQSVQVNSDGTVRFRLQDSTGENFSTTSTALNVGQWHHLAVTWDKTIDSGKLKIYIDGTEASYSATGNQTNNTNEVGDLVIGNQTSLYFDGKIDQVRIYDAALTSSQVTDLYNEKPEVDTSNFKTVLYEGNNSTQYISNVGFQPDLVWIKVRSAAGYNHNLFDTVRGATKRLISNLTNAEDSNGKLTSFDANGFSLIAGGDANPIQDMVAWCWKGGGDAATGSSSQATNVSYSANTEAGFSIVKFTSSSSTSTPPPMNYISHGLNSPVEMTIYTRLDSAQSWTVQHKDLDQAQAVYLDLTNAAGTPNPTYSFFDNTSQSGNIGVRSNFAITRGAPYIAYCWHSVAEYSKIGTYEGLGTSTVTVSDVGFKPSFIMIKNIDATANWNMYDVRRSTVADRANKILYPNLSNSEPSATNYYFDMNDSGFVVSATNHEQHNFAGRTYIYMAFK